VLIVGLNIGGNFARIKEKGKRFVRLVVYRLKIEVSSIRQRFDTILVDSILNSTCGIQFGEALYSVLDEIKCTCMACIA
jgi:hypothetical protein